MSKKQSNTNKATIGDVAKFANVSIATVSRALSKPDVVSQKTRKRIQDAIAHLQYSANISARNLRVSRTNMIAILLDDLGNTFYTAIIRGIEQEAMKQGYNILITPVNSILSKDDIYRKYLHQQIADGMIVLTGDLPLPEEYLTDKSLPSNLPPLVMACEALSQQIHPKNVVQMGKNISTVCINNKQSAYKATIHLLEQGHRDIVHIAGPEHSILTLDRIAGFKHALQQYGIHDSDDRVIVAHKFNTQAGEKAFDMVHQRKKHPTAVFFASDDLAIGFMSACRDCGISIGHTYSLIGFDNARFAKYTSPRLTTIHQPRENIGREAMKLLAQAIQNKDAPAQHIVLETTLIQRDSVFPIHTL